MYVNKLTQKCPCFYGTVPDSAALLFLPNALWDSAVEYDFFNVMNSHWSNKMWWNCNSSCECIFLLYGRWVHSARIAGFGEKSDAFSAFISHLPGVVWISPECISISFKLSGHLLNKFTQRAQMHVHTEQDTQICPAVCLRHMACDILVMCSRSK